MLDLKRIRNNPEEIKLALTNRGEDFDVNVIDELVKLDEQRRNILSEVEILKSKRNQVSAEIPKLKKAGEDVAPIMAEMKELGNEIKEHDTNLAEVNEKIDYIMLRIPNIPNPQVPEGDSDADNVEIKRWGEPKSFNGEPKAHWDLGADLGILDAERGGKVAGSRFTFYKGLGARLERAVLNYFMDKHSDDHGYTEILPPYMVNRNSMTGTGQLPKFVDDAFKVENNGCV